MLASNYDHVKDIIVESWSCSDERFKCYSPFRLECYQNFDPLFLYQKLFAIHSLTNFEKKFNNVMFGALFHLILMSLRIKAQNTIQASVLLESLNSIVEGQQSILTQLILINALNENTKCLLTCLWSLSYLWDRQNDVMSSDVPYTKEKNVSVKTNDSYTFFNYL